VVSCPEWEPLSLLCGARKLTLEPAAIEPIVPERTRSVRCRVRRLAFLGRQAVDALTRRGISLLHDAGIFVRGRRMRPATKRTPDAFGPAYSGMVAPPSAASALSRTRPGGSAPDLTVVAADDDLLTNKVSGIAAQNRVQDVDPRDTSVSVGRGAHEARGRFPCVRLRAISLELRPGFSMVPVVSRDYLSSWSR
jgi:hypothetical protein